MALTRVDGWRNQAMARPRGIASDLPVVRRLSDAASVRKSVSRAIGPDSPEALCPVLGAADDEVINTSSDLLGRIRVPKKRIAQDHGIVFRNPFTG
jgi:hypothetical protein